MTEHHQNKILIRTLPSEGDPCDYLIYIPEIEQYILSYLDPIRDGKNIILINKHFHGLMEINPIRTEFKEFLSREKSLTIYNANDVSDIQKLFFKACRYGYLNVVKFFWNNRSDKIDLHSDNDYAFFTSCGNGRINVAKFLNKIDIENKIDIHFRNDRIFVCVCQYNRLDVAKWLYQLCQDNKYYHKINICARFDACFSVSCSYGHLEMAIWLYQMLTLSNLKNGIHHTIDIHFWKNYCFMSACKRNHLGILKYLYSLESKTKFDYDLFEKLFAISCKYGNLDVAQWIYSVCLENNKKIDISFNYHQYFQSSCHRNYIKLVKWLTSLCDSYVVEIVDDRINRFWF